MDNKKINEGLGKTHEEAKEAGAKKTLIELCQALEILKVDQLQALQRGEIVRMQQPEEEKSVNKNKMSFIHFSACHVSVLWLAVSIKVALGASMLALY